VETDAGPGPGRDAGPAPDAGPDTKPDAGVDGGPLREPSVAFTNPVADPDGQAPCVTGTVRVASEAQADGVVASVAYAIDGNPIAGTPAPPRWEADWDTDAQTEGPHVLEAEARDTRDPPLVGRASLPVVVNRTAPSVGFDAPAEGFVSPGDPVDIDLSAAAANDCGLASVAAAASGPAQVALALDPTTLVARFDPAGLPSGAYKVEATATDRAGQTHSAQRGIVVDRAPTIVLVSPAPGATLAGSVVVQATAQDDLSAPVLALFVDDAPVAASFDAQGRATWNTVTATYGPHAVKVCAVDGRPQTVCASVDVTVDQPLLVRCRVLTCESGSAGCTCDLDGCWMGGRREAFGTVLVRAEVSDDEPMDRVEFLLDGATEHVAAAAPHEWVWNTNTEADATRTVACAARNTRGVAASDDVAGLAVDNCDRDHDLFAAASARCGGTDCNDADAAVKACAAPKSACVSGACVCSGSGATDTCILADAGYCRADGTCGDCANDGQCGTGYSCLSARCVRTCADHATCGAGRYCRADAPRLCTACSATDAAHCGTAGSPAGCSPCSPDTPVCSGGTCVCTSHASCGAGRSCVAGACADCSQTDAARCGTSVAPAGCRVCTGSTPACAAGVCSCAGSGATDSCIGAGGGYCSYDGTCAACTSDAQCGGYFCRDSHCVAPCSTDAGCGTGRYCAVGAAPVCTPCSTIDPDHCGTGSSPAGCARCTDPAPFCNHGTCEAPAGNPVQLAAGTGYRRVWASPLADTGIAARAVDPATGKAALYLVRPGAAPFQLSSGGSTGSVRFSAGAPAAALFVNNPNSDGVGSLVAAALDGAAPVTVSGGSGVPTGGAFFGANGARLLFVGSYDVMTDRGVLAWSTGTTTQTVGSGASAYTMVFDSAREHAVCATGLDSTGTGALVGVTMSTGVWTTLVTAAKAVSDRRPAFALSGDGTVLVYTDPAGALRRISTAGGASLPVAPAGKLPAVSADGATVAFFTAASMAVWSGGQVRELATAAGTAAPLLSADGSRVAWATGLSQAGGGLVGTVSVAAVSGGAPTAVGTQTAWDSVLFSPRSGRLAALTDLKDLTGQANYGNGLGRLRFGAPTAALPVQATGVPAANAGRFDAADRMVFVGAVQPGSGAAKIFVADGVGAPAVLKENAVKGSLRVAADADRAVFLAEPRADLVDDVYRAGTLYGTSPDGPPVALKADVVDAQFAAGGRALVVVADGAAAGVWSIGVP